MNFAETTNNETYDLFNEADEVAMNNSFAQKTLKIKTKEEAENFIRFCCEKKLGIPYNVMVSPLRERKVAMPRHLLVYILTRHSILTLYEIGKLFNRDHSVASHSRNVVENEFVFAAKHKNIPHTENYKYYSFQYDELIKYY